MSDYGDRTWDRATALGQANQVVVEMARRHCVHMRFDQPIFGGQGAAEAATGLPINLRQVNCPQASGDTSGMNLEVIAEEFYRQNCVGCVHRSPTGDVPNLATLIEEADAKAEQEADAARSAAEGRHREWQQRAEGRRAAVATADPGMAAARADLAILDPEPGTDAPEGERDAALRRLTAIAERAPDSVSQPVFDAMTSLAGAGGVVDLLGPLRQLAHHRGDLVADVLALSLQVLESRPAVEAGRVVSDFAALVVPPMGHGVIRSLVWLAGAPELDFLGRRRGRGTSNDPSGLRAAANVCPDEVVGVIATMLPGPQATAGLLLPAGERHNRGTGAADVERVAAAESVQALGATHPQLAGQLVDSLIRNLGVDPEDDYGAHPVEAVQRALASLVVDGVDDVANKVGAAGRPAGKELRDRLFGVFEAVAQLIDREDRWRQPGERQLPEDRQTAMADQLAKICLQRIGGDWGPDVAYEAAQVLQRLVKNDIEHFQPLLDAMLGAFILVIDKLSAKPTSTLMVEPMPPLMMAMEGFSWRHTHAACARELLEAVEHLASLEPVRVCRAVTDLIDDERENERGVEVVWRLLPFLGKVARRNSDSTAVLRMVLPRLHTYMVDSEAVLRGAAIEAWTDIGSVQPLPSSLSDLLPALLEDNYIAVIDAMLTAVPKLRWSAADQAKLLVYAVGICRGIDGQPKTLQKSMNAISALSRDNGQWRAYGEKVILARAGDLDHYDLREALTRRWLPESLHSPTMAALRLRQARDPQISGRFGTNDDDKAMTALLDCGEGLIALSTGDLAEAALDLAPDFPLGCAEFAEVAWRANRPADAAEIMFKVLETIPAVPAYDDRRAVAQLVADAASYDGRTPGADLAATSELLAAAVSNLPGDSDLRAELREQINARIVMRCLLAGAGLPGVLTSTPSGAPSGDPADQLEQRGQALNEAARQLDSASQRLTSTAEYVRAVAALCVIAGHLLSFEAAEMRADIAARDAHLIAVNRRSANLRQELTERFEPTDPLASRLIAALDTIGDVGATGRASDSVAAFAILSIPLLIVRGRRERRLPSPIASQAGGAESEEPIAVVFASLDGQLITGPQVLRSNLVHDLALEVRLESWPVWATHLDAELISHLGASEVQTPSITWARPSALADDQPLIGSGSVVLRFGLPAGQPAPPFLIALRFRGLDEAGEPVTQPIDVAGHRELRLRPFDASRDYLTDYPVFDERLLKLYEGLHAAGYDQDQVQAFCRLFTAICRIGLRMTWDKRYRKGTRVTEKEFHDELYAALHSEPELGGHLERGSPLALGFLDVRHDGITAELKVERKTAVTHDSAPKYMGQPTQYAAADGARLSILAILDMSPKASPIGTPENYVFTLEPALHGLENPEAPSIVATIIVNGNLPTPSSWSRRKTTLRHPPASA